MDKKTVRKTNSKEADRWVSRKIGWQTDEEREKQQAKRHC